MAAGRWFGRLLFRCTCGLAGLLVAAVVLAPWLPGAAEGGGNWARVVGLFAHDAAVRRTSLAAAAGLVVTAYVFFRQPPPPASP
jgi:hypothetical protein